MAAEHAHHVAEVLAHLRLKLLICKPAFDTHLCSVKFLGDRWLLDSRHVYSKTRGSYLFIFCMLRCILTTMHRLNSCRRAQNIDWLSAELLVHH